MDWNNNIPEELEAIIVDFLSGNISEENKQKLYDWLGKTKSNQRVFDEIKNTWLASGFINSGPNTEISWNSINNDIKKKEKHHHASHKKELETRLEIPLFLKIAASIVIFYVLGGLSWHFYTSVRSSASGQPIEIKSPLGSKSSISLPDGTHVTLNAGSVISYAKNYGTKTRDVHLEGEAFFDVVTNRKKPFRVKTSSITITALGTSFNVKAYEGEETIQTTLVEGKIKIENENNKNDYLYLEPRQVAVFKKSDAKIRVKQNQNQTETINDELVEPDILLKKSSVVLRIEDPKPYISWIDDQLVITGERLEELAKKLERMYDVRIEFESDVVKNYSFKGTLEKETLQQVLNAIRLTAPIKYKVNNKKVIVSEDSELKEKYERLLEKPME